MEHDAYSAYGHRGWTLGIGLWVGMAHLKTEGLVSVLLVMILG